MSHPSNCRCEGRADRASRMGGCLRKDCPANSAHPLNVPYEFDVAAIKDAVRFISLQREIVDRAIKDRNAKLDEALRIAGPGHAVGYRLKPTDLSAPDNDPLTLHWEFHVVELINGVIPVGHADFTYVTLKEKP